MKKKMWNENSAQNINPQDMTYSQNARSHTDFVMPITEGFNTP